uniref:Carboxylic ester hydrolase n=1 Tax=Scylla olivacea TaxID=85551 RepID=A0A0P4WCJ5_SCYOL
MKTKNSSEMGHLNVVVVVAMLTGCVMASQSVGDQLVVSTEDGKISGFREYSTKGRAFYSFQGIPYAKPPVGQLRFKDPVASEGWTGVRDGTMVPPTCSQIPFFELTMKERKYKGEEDCLFLNVFSPVPSENEEPLPVLVFLHGGGFFAGGMDYYNGYVLMNEDVIMVLVQYRLGVLGFLSTEDSVMPGNFGLKDQTLALHWVQRNIRHFGGDPERVTLFGESAGGASVHFHLLSPYSHDLFVRGIMMSGTLFSPWAMGGAHKDVAWHTARLFGCPEPQDNNGLEASEALLRCLQGVDVKNLTLSLMDHVSIIFNPVLMGPRVDGDYLPAEPEVLMAKGRHKITDIISGITAHEGGLFALPLYSSDRLQSDLVNNFSEMGPASLEINEGDRVPLQISHKIFDYYVGGVKVEKENADKICQLFGDRHFNIGHDLVSALYARNAAPKKMFLYSLDHRGQRSLDQFYDVDIDQKWVSHVDDLFYLFTGGTTVFAPLERDDDLRLRDIITKLWVNFAASGNPTPDDSLGFIWQPAADDYLQHLSLTPTPVMKDDTRKEVRAFWETLPTKQNLILHPEKVVPISEDTAKRSPGARSPTAPMSVKKYRLIDEL